MSLSHKRRNPVRLCTKSPYTLISLCNLCVLCASVVSFCSEFINHRDTEDTEVAPRRARPGLLVQAAEDRKGAKSVYDTTGVRRFWFISFHEIFLLLSGRFGPLA